MARAASLCWNSEVLSPTQFLSYLGRGYMALDRDAKIEFVARCMAQLDAEIAAAATSAPAAASFRSAVHLSAGGRATPGR